MFSGVLCSWRCRSLDMTLDEIGSCCTSKSHRGELRGCESTAHDRHIGHVAQRIQELQELEKQLKGPA